MPLEIKDTANTADEVLPAMTVVVMLSIAQGAPTVVVVEVLRIAIRHPQVAHRARACHHHDSCAPADPLVHSLKARRRRA